MEFLRNLLPTLGRWPRRCAALLCLVLAAGSVLAARDPDATATPQHRVAVAVARHDLAAGTTLTASDLVLRHWPRELVPRGASSRVTSLAGRRITGPLSRGEPVLPTDLSGPGLAAGLDPGQVAVPVLVDDQLAGGFIRSGDHVDLLAGPPGIAASGTGRQPPSAAVIAEKVLVLAVLSAQKQSGDTGATELILATDQATARHVATLTGSRMLAVLNKSP